MATFNIVGFFGFKKGNRTLKKSVAAYKTKNFDESFSLFAQAMKEGADKKLLLIQMASAIQRRLKWKEASEAYNYILNLPKINNDFKKACEFSDSICKWKMGKAETAINQLRAALNNVEYSKLIDVRDYLPLAYILLQNKRFDEALEVVEQALELKPDNSFALSYKGQIAYLQNNLEDAKEFLLDSLDARSTVEANYYMGLICLSEDDKEAAKDYFTDALDCAFDPLSPITEKIVNKQISKL